MTVSLNGPVGRKIAAAVADGRLVIQTRPRPTVVDVRDRRYGAFVGPVLPMVRVRPPIDSKPGPIKENPNWWCVPIEIVDALEEVTVPDRTVDRITASLNAIIYEVCWEFQTTNTALKSPSRRAEDVIPRQVVMYLARRLTRLSLPQIGRRLGDRDHTTVMAGEQSILRRMAMNADLAARVAKIQCMFEGRP